jgi:DNA-binding GntR family transcriptional regulator
LIKENEGHIKEVLNWPLSVERTSELNESYKYSKTLLSENNDYINLQVAIMNFLNKHKTKIEAVQSAVRVNASTQVLHGQNLSRDDYFRLTIENDIVFDNRHPYFNDENFYAELFSYFEKSENYEMCAELVKLKK